VAYKADITIMAHDRTALLMEITNVIGEAKIPLKAINARTTKDQIAIMNLILEITNTEQLESISEKLTECLRYQETDSKFYLYYLCLFKF